MKSFCSVLAIISTLSIISSEKITLHCDNKFAETEFCIIKNVHSTESSEFEFEKKQNFSQLRLSKGTTFPVLPKGLFLHFNELEYLNGHEIGLKSLTPALFEGATELKGVFLTKNNLTKVVKDTFVSCPKIEEIELHLNQISEIEVGAFNGGKNVEKIKLNENQIASLPVGAFKGVEATLRWLDLGDNRLETLPEGIFDQLTKLHGLHLANNPITSLPDKIFASIHPEAMISIEHAQLKNDTFVWYSSASFDLSHNQLKTIHIGPKTQGIKAKNNSISSVVCSDGGHEITRLSLANNQLTEFGCIRHLPNLMHLNLDGNRIEKVQEDDLKEFSELIGLRLERNGLKVIDGKGLGHLTSLNTLWLAMNKIQGISITKDVFPEFVGATLEENDWKCDNLKVLIECIKDIGGYFYSPDYKPVKEGQHVEGIKCHE